MAKLQEIIEKNRKWAQRMKAEEPGFFLELSAQQNPEYLWIGCSDSRVPANQICGLMPGEIFVHRNVANIVVHSDMNCLSVLQYAVEVLKVKHIIVCGHYRCGGVKAALDDQKLGLIGNWLRPIQHYADKHSTLLETIQDPARRWDKLCELSILEQVRNVCMTTIVCDAWERKQAVTVHAWIYGVENGLIKDLNLAVTSSADLAEQYPAAVLLAAQL